MGFDIGGPTKFFGRGGDSVLGRVGGEITNNFNDFKDAIGADLFTGPSTRADLIDDKLVSEDDIVSAVSRNYALRKTILTEQNIKKEAVKKLPKDFIMENEMLPFELNGRILKIALLIH